MAKIFLDDQTAGRTYVARFTQDSDGYVWNGSAWVAPTTLTDTALEAAVNGVTLDAVVNGETPTASHIGYSLTIPVGITTACHISIYLTSYTAGDAEDYGADYDPGGVTSVDVTNACGLAITLSEEITDIKAKTDLIPASPAAVGSAMVVSDKTGFKLASDGLDQISATPVANPTTWPQRIMWFVQRFFYSAKTPTELITKDSAGATLTTQAITDDGAGTETMGPPA